MLCVAKLLSRERWRGTLSGGARWGSGFFSGHPRCAGPLFWRGPQKSPPFFSPSHHPVTGRPNPSPPAPLPQGARGAGFRKRAVGRPCASDFCPAMGRADFFWVDAKKVRPFLAPQKSQKSPGAERTTGAKFRARADPHGAAGTRSGAKKLGADSPRWRQSPCRATAGASCRRAWCTSGTSLWRVSWRPCRRSFLSAANPR